MSVDNYQIDHIVLFVWTQLSDLQTRLYSHLLDHAALDPATAERADPFRSVLPHLYDDPYPPNALFYIHSAIEFLAQ